jgi:hypothetical protein
MQKRNRVIQCLTAILTALHSASFAQAPVIDLPERRCTLQEVIGHLQFQSFERRAAIAEQTLPLLKTVEALNNKAKDPKKPIGEQLSIPDLEKFSRASQQMQTMQLTSLMESRRLRDLKAIERMAILADQEYRWTQTPKDGTDDAAYHSAYQVIKLVSKNLELSEPKTKQCTLEFALHKQMLEPTVKLEPLLPQLPAASSFVKSLNSKYKMDPIDRKKLTASDRAKYDDLETNLFSVFRKNYEYMKDIESIKVLASALELMHQASMQDIAIGGGSFDVVGKTIQRNIQNKAYDESTQLAMGMWTKINERIPSQDVTDWKKFSTK